MPDHNRTLGGAIRRRRLERGISLRSAAAIADVSASFLSQAENDKARPRIETLHRIASALGTTAQAILADASGPSVIDSDAAANVVRSGENDAVTQSDDVADGVVRSLAGGHGFHAMEIRGAPEEFGPPYSHPGDELLYVVAGHVEVEVGDERHRLGPGDSLAYAGETAHRTRRLDDHVQLIIVTSGAD